MSEQRTVRVRIAVAVDPQGRWAAQGWFASDPDWTDVICDVGSGEVRYWIEADVPLPAPPAVIEGVASPAEADNDGH